jgi:hypothetical protein
METKPSFHIDNCVSQASVKGILFTIRRVAAIIFLIFFLFFVIVVLALVPLCHVGGIKKSNHPLWSLCLVNSHNFPAPVFEFYLVIVLCDRLLLDLGLGVRSKDAPANRARPLIIVLG